jgi:hypothetical protein
MWTGTRVAMTETMSGSYVPAFIRFYLFIRTYMSALVDTIQDYKNCHGKMRWGEMKMPAVDPWSCAGTPAEKTRKGLLKHEI